MIESEMISLDKLFGSARSQNGWLDQPVSDDEIRRAFDIGQWGPTSMNTQPMRLILLRSAEAKARLTPALAPGNVQKALTAPVVAIIAYTRFFDHLPRTFPHNPNARDIFAGNEPLAQATAFRNGTLQGAYFMIALRAVGLDVGPMSGFDPAKVDAEFFADTNYRTNFLCGIGRGDSSKILERLPRLTFEEVAEVI